MQRDLLSLAPLSGAFHRLRRSAGTRLAGTALPWLLSVLTMPPIYAADVWCDGANSGLTGDGIRAGRSATWDGSSINWDQGTGHPRVPWSNASSDTANFGGVAGTVTLGLPITANAVVFTSSNYTLSSSTLTLAGTTPRLFNSGTVTVNSALAGTAGLTKSG